LSHWLTFWLLEVYKNAYGDIGILAKGVRIRACYT